MILQNWQSCNKGTKKVMMMWMQPCANGKMQLHKRELGLSLIKMALGTYAIGLAIFYVEITNLSN